MPITSIRTRVDLWSAICDRVERDLPLVAARHSRITRMMDLESVPELDLEALLAAEPADFNHDLAGIHGNMDRSSFPGRFRRPFAPRHSTHQTLAA